MKIVLPIAVLLVTTGCGSLQPRGSGIRFGGGSYNPKPNAGIKIGKINAPDSLKLRYEGKSMIIPIPYKEKTFSVVCITTQDVILRSADNKFIIFVIQTQKWSTLLDGPSKDCP